MFSCPFSDATVHITDESELDDGTDPYTLDYDNNDTTREFRFTTDSRYTETNDPDYLIDPEIPSNSSPNRAIYADGPDFAYMRQQWATDTGNPQADFPARRYIPHGSTVMVLFYDGHVTQLDANDQGQVANTEYPAGDSQMTDDDIYSDDPNIGPRIDCHLGNYDNSGYWAGPDSDVNTDFEWPWQ
jgi:prepilin-type processing-associated H-X9-DG protein